MFSKGYRVFCIIFYMRVFLASYDALNHSLLKRKLEESCSEVYKSKRCAYDISALSKRLKRQTDKKDIVNEKNKKCISNDQIVKDEKGLMSSNPQLYDATYDHLKNNKTELVNGQLKTIKGKALVVTNEANTILESKEKSWKNLLMTTEQKKIRNYYKTQMQQQLNNISVYSYSNSMFLDKFLNSPLSNFTVDSIRIRFSSGFLNFLSTDQLTRVLTTLLSKDLKFTIAERSGLVEMIFGHIDLSLERYFNNNQIVRIVTALLSSDVPHCFEQVFLTWKMWRVFTTKEQEQMLENAVIDINQADKAREGYKKETLVMLYLFILNRDAVNSSICVIFKECIVKIHGRPWILDNVDILNSHEYIEKNLAAANMLDTSLLDLPNVLKKLSDTNLTKFKDFVKQDINTEKGMLYSTCFGKRYKIHICYALTKFTREIAQNNDEGVKSICDSIYFEPEYIKNVLIRWSIVSVNTPRSTNKLEINEFRNVYGAIRQIVQSKGYNGGEFLRLFHMMNIHDFHERLFALILFSLTKEDILREVNKTLGWSLHIKNRSINPHVFAYIEDIFMYNANSNSIVSELYYPNVYIERITSIYIRLINRNKEMQRECYLYQQLLYHPKFELFTNYAIKSYILGLNKTGQLFSEKKCVQIARDLIFSKYYYESAVNLELVLIKTEGPLGKFKKSLEEECKQYGNLTSIENERMALENC
ncbi:hypothetical protein PAEPH01_0950 [Pancytospora epiphaga]|nr:hypothetical protein PAEPH01_0950 [Pancytospora epiphaga]